MRGTLKAKSPGTQLLVVISIALASFFILSMLGMVILSQITGISIFQMGEPAKWDYTKPSTITLIRGMQVIQFITLFAIPTWLCTYFLTTDRYSYLGFRNPGSGYIIAGLGAMILSIPFVNWMGDLNRQVHFPPGIEAWMRAKEAEASVTIRALLSQHTLKDLFLNLFFVAVLAAVGEELLFRGLLQRLFIKLFRSPIIGIVISAFLFSAMHLQFYGFLPRFLLGIILGLIYWYSGSLWVAIIAHFVYDAILIVLAYFYPEMLNDETTVKVSNMVVAGALSFIATVALVIWMKANSKTRYSQVYADDAVPIKDHPF